MRIFLSSKSHMFFTLVSYFIFFYSFWNKKINSIFILILKHRKGKIIYCCGGRIKDRNSLYPRSTLLMSIVTSEDYRSNTRESWQRLHFLYSKTLWLTTIQTPSFCDQPRPRVITWSFTPSLVSDHTNVIFWYP